MKETTVLAIMIPVLALVVLIMGCVAMNYRHREKMAEMGYIEVSYPGSYRTHWERQK